MTVAITIRNVPDEVRNTLAARAARSGQSLQEYLLAQFSKMADKPPLDEVIAEIRARVEAEGTRIGAEEIVRSIREDRDGGHR